MSVTLSGLKMDTPEVNRTFAEGFVADVIAASDALTYETDWEQEDHSTCPMCHGTGFQIHKDHNDEDKKEYCINCDGTGIEYTLHYGVKSKQSYAYVVEYGVEHKKEFCKAMRESYADVVSAGKLHTLSMVKPYALPKTIEMEAMAQGFDINAHRNQGEIKAIFNWVASNYPDFRCIPYFKL